MLYFIILYHHINASLKSECQLGIGIYLLMKRLKKKNQAQWCEREDTGKNSVHVVLFHRKLSIMSLILCNLFNGFTIRKLKIKKELILTCIFFIIFHCFFFKMSEFRGWRGGSAIKSTDGSSRGPWFNFQHHMVSMTSALGNPALKKMRAHTRKHMLAKANAHKIKIN